MIGRRQEMERLRWAYESSLPLGKVEGYNQPNENLTSDGMKTLQVKCLLWTAYLKNVRISL